jgi:hypothetical protein
MVPIRLSFRERRAATNQCAQNAIDEQPGLNCAWEIRRKSIQAYGKDNSLPGTGTVSRVRGEAAEENASGVSLR